MVDHHPTSSKSLRMTAEAFQERQAAGEPVIVLDVRGARDWDASDTKIPGALRLYPEVRIDPHWPRDRLILAY